MGNRNDLRGIYNVEYFSGSQAAIYIGDTWVDEITSFGYQVTNSRSPIYGYASQLFDAVSKGQVIVQGQFSINFKEAGYLFLVLDRYQSLFNPGYNSALKSFEPSPTSGIPIMRDRESNNHVTNEQNIEKIIQGEVNILARNQALQSLAKNMVNPKIPTAGSIGATLASVQADLTGFASSARAIPGQTDRAENIFEAFEDRIWGSKPGDRSLDTESRRADDPKLNPFDIYLTYGDYVTSDLPNHTVRKLSDVTIVGSAQSIMADGQPIQEIYSFIARNIV